MKTQPLLLLLSCHLLIILSGEDPVAVVVSCLLDHAYCSMIL